VLGKPKLTKRVKIIAIATQRSLLLSRIDEKNSKLGSRPTNLDAYIATSGSAAV
jgi:hypothetical protein